MDLPPFTLAGQIFDSSYEDLTWSNHQVGDDLPPITMAGQILGSSYEDVMWSNQKLGDKGGLDGENSCPICGRAVFGGINALYIHYSDSHCLQDEVMTCQMPEVNPLPQNPTPILPLPNPSSHMLDQDNQASQFLQVEDQCSTTGYAACSYDIMVSGENEKRFRKKENSIDDYKDDQGPGTHSTSDDSK